MRKIQENVQVFAQVTLPTAAKAQSDVVLPTLGDRVAFQMVNMSVFLNPTGFATSGGAGVFSAEVVFAGSEQATPGNLIEVEDLVCALAYYGSAGGAGSNITYLPALVGDGEIRPILFKDLIMVVQGANFGTAPTFDFLFGLDVYQLTTSEYVDILD